MAIIKIFLLIVNTVPHVLHCYYCFKGKCCSCFEGLLSCDTLKTVMHYHQKLYRTAVYFKVFRTSLFPNPVVYRIMEYLRVAKFSRFCLKNMGINFCGRQHLRIIISILFCENYRVGGIAQISFDRSTVQKENLQPKYLKHKGIKDTCILTDKQAKRTYLHSDGLIK